MKNNEPKKSSKIERLWAAASDLGNPYRADAMCALFHHLLKKDLKDEAIALGFEAMNHLAELEPGVGGHLAYVLSLKLEEAERSQESLEVVEQVLWEYREAQNYTFKDLCLWQRAGLYWDINMFLAIEDYKAAAEVLLEQNNWEYVAVLWRNTARAHRELKDFDEASKYAAKAITLLKEHSVMGGLSETYLEMSEIHNAAGNVTLSYKFLSKAIKLAKHRELHDYVQELQFRLAEMKLENGEEEEAIIRLEKLSKHMDNPKQCKTAIQALETLRTIYENNFEATKVAKINDLLHVIR